MATQMQCPHCGQTYDLTPEQVPQYAGQTITCTKCQQAFTVPANLAGGAGAGAPLQPTAAPTPPGMPPAYPQYQAQYELPAGERKSNGFAIASLVCGILGCTGIGAILAIIFGILGIQRAKDPRYSGGQGLSIAGIVLGGLMLFAACPVSILLPALNRARETANRVKCANNMRQIGQAILLYANDNRGAYPPDLQTVLTTQDITPEVFVCPSSNDSAAPGADAKAQANNLTKGGHLSYVYIGKGMTNSTSAETVVMYENLADHSNDGGNFLFGDGHVEWYSKPTAQNIIAQVQSGTNPPDFSRRGNVPVRRK